MRIVIFGATGGTGRELVRQAGAAGYAVAAVARHLETLTVAGASVELITADVTDCASVVSVVRGADVVLSALGTRRLNETTTVYSAGVTNILAAMRDAGVRRLVAISAVPVGAPHGLAEHVIFPILYRFFGAAYDDMKRMEAILAASDSEWTVFRPPQLVDRPATGRYRTAIDAPLPAAWRITRADLAAAMLASINDAALVRHIVTISN
ncbi:MAG: NAD(P)H-binding protein [Candidatus Aquilonibacter sp.]